MTAIVGVHPYAEEFPMASSEELDELTESIGSVGLIHAITVTPDGLVLDGRNRLEACERAQVQPRAEVREGTDDEYKEFVIGVNTTGRRESMTVQIAAASTALILGEERRINGQWKRHSVSGQLSTKPDAGEVKALARCGFVLDILGRDALRRVRDQHDTLNAVYEEAQKAVHDARAEAERAAAEAEAEAEARDFIEGHRPDLAEKVGVDPLVADWRTAKAIHEQQHREETAARKREEAMRAAAQQKALNEWRKACDGLLVALSYAKNGFQPPVDTDVHPTEEQFKERLAALVEVVNTWKES